MFLRFGISPLTPYKGKCRPLPALTRQTTPIPQRTAIHLKQITAFHRGRAASKQTKQGQAISMGGERKKCRPKRYKCKHEVNRSHRYCQRDRPSASGQVAASLKRKVGSESYSEPSFLRAQNGLRAISAAHGPLLQTSGERHRQRQGAPRLADELLCTLHRADPGW